MAGQSVGLSASVVKQLPVSLGDDLDGAIGHLDGVLIGNRLARHFDQLVVDARVLDAGGSEK